MGQGILLVEDEDIIAENVQETLADLGFEIVGRASTADDAALMVKEEDPALVLMDINIEGEKDGVMAATMISAISDVPIVYLTSLDDDATFERVKITEPEGYVKKPFTAFELRSAVELALLKSGNKTARSSQSVDTGQEAPALSENEQKCFDALGEFEFFQALGEDAKRTLARASRLQSYDAKESVAFEGEEHGNGFIVVSGRVAMVKTSSNGKELTVELIPPGDPFPLFAAVDARPLDTSLHCQVESELLWIPKASVLLLLESYPDVMRLLMSEVFGRLRKSHDLARALAHDQVDVRIATALFALTPRFCKPKEVQGAIVQSIDMTRQELSELIGSTPETVIRVTKKMERDGILDLSQSGTIAILDQNKLRLMAGSA